MIFKDKNYSNCIPKLLLKNWLFRLSVSPLVNACNDTLFVFSILKAHLKVSALKMEQAINRASYGYEMIAKTLFRTTLCSFYRFYNCVLFIACLPVYTNFSLSYQRAIYAKF